MYKSLEVVSGWRDSQLQVSTNDFVNIEARYFEI